jgi:hypothetical protein
VKNDLKRAIVEAMKENVESMCEEIMEFQRTGLYDLMHMKTKNKAGNKSMGY